MKRRIISLLFAALLLLPISAAVAAGTPVTITSEDVRGNVGDTVTVAMNLTVEAPKLGQTMDSLQFVLEYDSAALEFVEIQELSQDRMKILGVEYTCNSNHRYGNEYCTAHTIREPQLDEIIHTELAMLRQEILDSSQKYDEIVKDWNKKKPKYDKMIKEYSQKIVTLNGQIEELIMERIGDREHAKVYNSMIEKREAEIAELTQKIEDCRKFDELSKKRRDELMSTAELLDEVLLEPYISDANMRLLVRKINVHENEDGSLDVTLEFNGDFKDTSTGCFEIND